jgi:hypothetical protein
MALTLHHQTGAEFAQRFWRNTRAAYDAGDKLVYHRNIWWLWTKIQAGDITSDGARAAYNSAFGTNLNVSQWNNLVTTRFVPIKDRYVAFLAETFV